MNFANLIFRGKKFYRKNEQKILVLVSSIGIIASVVSAAKGGIKAAKVLEEAKADKEVIKARHACGGMTDEDYKRNIRRANIGLARDLSLIFAPTACFTGLSLGSLALGYKVSIAKQTALTIALQGSEMALNEFKEKAKEVVGDGKFNKINTEIIKDKVRESTEGLTPIKNDDVKEDNKYFEPHLYYCVESYGMQHFVSNRTRIEAAMNKYSFKIRNSNETELPINNLYNILDPKGEYLKVSPAGNSAGFSTRDLERNTGEVPYRITTIEDEILGPVLFLDIEPHIL